MNQKDFPMKWKISQLEHLVVGLTITKIFAISCEKSANFFLFQAQVVAMNRFYNENFLNFC